MPSGEDSTADALAAAARGLVVLARELGVEWTESDTQDLIRDGFKAAAQDFYRAYFVRLLNGDWAE